MGGNEVEIRVTGRDSTGDLFDKVERRSRSFLERLLAMFSNVGKAAGEKLADGLWRSADGRLRDSKGRFVKAGDDAGDSFGRGFLTGMMAKLADAVTDVGSAMFKILTGNFSAAVSSGPFGILAAAILAVVAAAALAEVALFALAPTVLLVGGAFGAAATAGFGLVGMLGALLVGLGGLGDAWKAYGQKSGGGGGAGAAAAREVKSATDALADAQRAAARASEDVTRARMDETERLEDLSRALAGAMLDEEGAVLAVRRAELQLRDARRGGTGLDRAEADLGLRRAKQSLEEVRDRVGDLRQEKEEADRKGVEGSERVQSALERQMLAQRHLEDATRRLADAQKGSGAGGVNKYAEAMAALSANGQALITTLIGLKPKFDDLQKSVQNRLLAGMDVTIKDLATKWFPVLDRVLGDMAGSINSFFTSFARGISTPQFMADFSAIVGSFGSWLERFGGTVERLMGALGRLGRASIPFIEKLGDLFAGMLDNFSAWITKIDESGELDDFMTSAVHGLEKLWTIGGLVVTIIGELIETFMGPSKREAGGVLDSIQATLEDWKEWLSDPENQQKIRDWVSDVQDFGDKVGEAMLTVGEWIIKIDGWIAKIDNFVSVIASLPGRIGNASKGMFDGIKEAFRAALNWVIDKWNSLEFRLPSASFLGVTVGGATLGTIDIKRFAQGGIGGGLSRVAERGRELIDTPGGMLLAMPHGSNVIPNGTTEAMLSGGKGGEVVVRFDFGKAGMDEMRRLMQKIVDVYGAGNVQVAIGKGA